MNPFRRLEGTEAFSAVLGFTLGHWRRQKARLAWISAVVVLSTAADVLLPIYAGRLVDAVALGASDRAAAYSAALHAFVAMLLLGAFMVALRHVAFLGVIRLTLRMMQEIAAEAFHRVQRFSTEWHASSFARSSYASFRRSAVRPPALSK